MVAREPREELEKMKKNKEITYLILAILCVWVPMFMGAFDKDKPASSTSLRNSNPEILANWSALETSSGNEHEFSTGGTNSGDHTQGSARSFSQATAPATQIDGGAFASTDLGLLWVDTDDNAFYMLTATTPTWTPVSTEVIATMLGSARVFGSTLGVTGNFAVNTNKFAVVAATGNTAVAGTLDVTGNIDPTTYETTNGGFLDEDDMASDSATKVASQQSIKAIVDTKEATLVTQATASIFGARTTLDSIGGTLVAESVYQAECDGFLTAFHSVKQLINATILSDSSNPPTTVIARSISDNGGHNQTITVPIRKDDYWKATKGIRGLDTIFWVPIGTGDSVKQ